MPVSPIASRSSHNFPIDDTTVAGPSAPGPAQAGKILLEEISAQVIEPDLSKFMPEGKCENEAALKRATLANFRGHEDFHSLRTQTEGTLKEAAFLDLPGKPILMPQKTADECLAKWGLISPVTAPESLDPSLYDLYSYGLPNLARAVAVSRALRTQTTAVDVQSQGEIRQALRNLFADGLTVSIPAVIQNIEEVLYAVVDSVTPLSLADEVQRHALKSVVAVLSKYANEDIPHDSSLMKDKILTLAALKKALNAQYGLEWMNDEFASSGLAWRALRFTDSPLKSELDVATAPQVLGRSLASDLMNQMRQRMHAEGSAAPSRNADLVQEMTAKLRRKNMPCSTYTIGKIDPKFKRPTQLSNSLAPLAITLLQQGQRQGLFKIAETKVEIPRQGLPKLKLLRVDNMVCSMEKAGALGRPNVLVPLTLEALLPGTSTWLKSQLEMPNEASDDRCLVQSNLGLAALMEACQNSKGGVWASVWQSGGQAITANQAKAFLGIMSVKTPELADLFGRGKLNSASVHNLLITVAQTDTNTNMKIFSRIPTTVMEDWLKGLKKRLGPDARRLDPMVELGKKMYTHNFTECLPLALAAARLGVRVDFPVLPAANEESSNVTMNVHSPQWVDPMLSLALPEQKVRLREALVRNTLLQLVTKKADGQIDILDALVQKKACAFTNQEIVWQLLLDINKNGGLPGDNLSKLLDWTVSRTSKPWPPTALSLLFNAIENNKIRLDTVRAFLASPSLKSVSEGQDTSPAIRQTNLDYIGAVAALLNQCSAESVKLAFELGNTLQGSGFSKVYAHMLTRKLNVAGHPGFIDLIESASQSKLIPKDFIEPLLEKVCLSPSLSDVDATRMAGHLLNNQFEQSDSSFGWNLANRAVDNDKHQLATLMFNRLVGIARMNQLDEDGFALLHYYAEGYAHGENHKLIRAMVAAGADVNIKGSGFLRNGETPLDLAIRYENEQARQVLIELGADANI